ncbi:MAG: ABC transporter substrate-binding protein [Clostridiales bacterium]|nr:ABC transporter substrate-binding protein [Clostridiales bacterium]MDY3746033.1 ABC transporter substrate-binding protein [Lachnospiraceae bacterium]
MRKKVLTAWLLVLCMCVGALAGCGTKKENETESQVQSETLAESAENTDQSADTEAPADSDSAEGESEEVSESLAVPSEVINIGAMKGPTAMGMAQLLDDANYNVSIVASPDEIVPMIVQGKVDIAAVPANLASTLYQKTEQQVTVLAINTLGVLYIVENGETITSVEDLKGKTIYASGKGATPEYALNSVLKAHGIDPEADVTIEYKSEHAEVVSALLADRTAVGLLPQPFVTTALMKNENLRVALDLNELWESGSSDGSRLVTGVVIAKNEYLSEHKADVEAFLQAYEQSVDFVNEDIEAAAKIIGAHDIVAEEVAKKAIPQCSIVFIDGDEMKTMLSGYLNTLFEQNPQIIGGQIPDDAFYYQR